MPSEPTAIKRVVIYVRISSDPTGRAAGVERQEQECRELADGLGWPVVEVRRDNDISAYSGKTRPGYQAMLADLAEGRADALIAWHSDRLYRGLEDLGSLIKVVRSSGAAVRTVRAGTVDLSTASGVMTSEILASVAKHEVAHSIERMVLAKNQAAQEGRWRGGPRPFGYEADGVTVRSLVCPGCDAKEGFTADRECGACGGTAEHTPGSEAWWVEHGATRILEGDSLREVCRIWERAGVRTVPRARRKPDGSRTEPTSRPWAPIELRRLLLRARNAGLLEQHGEVIGRANWAPILTEETWREVKAALEAPERRTTTGNARRWLGSGLYLCGACGDTMRPFTSGDSRHQPGSPWRLIYRCRASAHVARDATRLDEYVTAVIIERLSRPDAVHLAAVVAKEGASLAKLSERAAGLRAKLAEIAEDYAADRTTRAQMLTGTQRAREQLAEVEVQISRVARRPLLASLPLGTDRIEAEWAEYGLDKRRSVMGALMTVTVLKAQRGRPKGFVPGSGKGYFDPATVHIDWKL